MSHPDRGLQVSDAFVALAGTLVDDFDIVDMLDHLLAHCVALLDADAAGLMLGDAQGQLRVAATSSDDARTVELLQLQTDEGPCLEAYRTVTQVRVPDLADVADRWPTVAAAAAGAFRSAYALPLRLRGHAIGVVNLLRRNPDPLPDADLVLGQALADMATVGILSERAIRRGEIVGEQLQAALHSRVVVEQAKGVLAERLGVEMNVALDRLRRYARAHDLRTADVAHRVVHGELDLTRPAT